MDGYPFKTICAQIDCVIMPMETFKVAEKRPVLRRQGFIKTSQYLECKSFLDTHGVILITGDAGSGKTSLARQLFTERKGRTSGNCFQIQHPDELRYLGTAAKVVLFDDIFGHYVEDISKTMAWYSQIEKIQQLSSKNVVIILTCTEDIFFRCKDRKKFNFLMEYVVQLSSIELRKCDWENVTKEYDCPYAATCSDLKLFQMCEVWSFLKSELAYVDRTFEMSQASVENLLGEILEKEKDVCFAVLITLIFGNNLSEKDLESQKLKRVAELIDYNINMNIILGTLQKFLLREENTYSISSFVIYDAACTFLVKRYPDIFIENCELEVLDKLSKYFEIVEEDHVENLCKRLSSELAHLVDHKLYNPLKNGRTLRIFLDVLSNCEEEKDLFLNSDFLCFTCWSGNDIIVESLLRRMKGRNSVIKSALECCSSEVLSVALKKYLKVDDSPQSPNIYDAMQEDPFSAVLSLDAVECQLKEFPRLRYHSKLIKGLGDRFMKLQSMVPELKIPDFEHWNKTNDNPIIYLAGGAARQEEAYMQLSFLSETKRSHARIAKSDQRKPKSTKTFADFTRGSPSCVLFCCEESESKSTTISFIKKLAEDVANSKLTLMGRCVIIVLNSGKRISLSKTDFKDIQKDNVEIVTSINDRSDHDDLFEYLTSAFEIPMIEYIRLLQLKLNDTRGTASANRLLLLKTEMDALLQRLQLSSKLVQETAKASTSMIVPKKVLAELDKNADKIYGYGFRPEEFYVLIDDRLSPKEKESLEKKIRKQLRKAKEFTMNVTFENSKGVNVTKHFGPGIPVLPDKSKPEKYGTLGGFALINSTEVVGLTNYHVISQDIEAYIKNEDIIFKLGKCTLVFVPGKDSLADFALIKVDEELKERCKQPLVDDEREPKSATVFCGELGQICPAIVHKNGASTGITQGTIVQSLNYREVLGDRETRSVFLVEDLEEEKFSKPGDSGSLVFQNSLSARQSSIEVLAILNGRFENRDETLTEESRYIVCSNMKLICENLKKKGKRLQFFETNESSDR